MKLLHADGKFYIEPQTSGEQLALEGMAKESPIGSFVPGAPTRPDGRLLTATELLDRMKWRLETRTSPGMRLDHYTRSAVAVMLETAAEQLEKLAALAPKPSAEPGN